jgi:hypothetical protein
MPHGWRTTKFRDLNHAHDVLTELHGKRWISRGESEDHRGLLPTIDRPPLVGLSRLEKLSMERQSIDLFRSSARYFASETEAGALKNDLLALAVMRHYGVPTRLLDWSLSPFVAAYFACEKNNQDGEIWSFDHDRYVRQGSLQWRDHPETTHGRSGNPSHFDQGIPVAFTPDEPPDLFVCKRYQEGFHRQDAQDSFYSISFRFGRKHDDLVAKLLDDPGEHELFVIPASLKDELRRKLRERHGVWSGSLFPDSAGAAETVRRTLFKQSNVFPVPSPKPPGGK